MKLQLSRMLEPSNVRDFFWGAVLRASALRKNLNCRWLQPTIPYYAASWPELFRCRTGEKSHKSSYDI